MTGRLARWAPVVGWVALIFVLSSIPGRSLPPEASIAGMDKLAHALVFGVLGYLIARAAGGNGWRAFLVATICVAVYGVFDEWHQRYTPGRDSSVWDFAADTLGGAVGAAAQLFVARRRVDADHP